MKLAYVVPRYGLEVVGGAEYGARMLAERLVAMKGWDVEIFTTTALDVRTWADELPSGTVDVNGVTVHRFDSLSGRQPDFDGTSERVLLDPARAAPRDAKRWIELQGPVNPDLIAGAAASDADLVAFYPYLYHPTVHGVPAVGRRAVMHPAAHDEPPLKLPLFGPVFQGVSGLVFQTWSERHLVERMFRVAGTRQIVVGLGVEEGPGEPDAARAALGIGDDPYLVCVGRVDDGKGTGMLATFFGEYKRRRPGPLKLVLIGPVVDQPDPHPDVLVVGPVDEPTKWGAIRGSVALVSPSAFEAFSLVVVEGWTAGVPVVVHGRCAPTKEHCERSGGGLWFDGYAMFEAVVDRLAGDDVLHAELARRGREYVDANFRWTTIIDRYAAFLDDVAAHV